MLRHRRKGRVGPSGAGGPGELATYGRKGLRPRKEDLVRNVRVKGVVGLKAAAVTLAASAAPAAAQNESTSTVIYACINKSTGNSRLAAPTTGTPISASASCTAAEFTTKMFWNQTGPQ